MIEAWQLLYAIALVTGTWTPVWIVYLSIPIEETFFDDGGPKGGLKLQYAPGAHMRTRGCLIWSFSRFRSCVDGWIFSA